MFNPFYDPSGMSDKELQQKINDQSLRISSARAAGMSDSIIGNMQIVLNQCYEEMTLRQGRKEKDTYEEADPCIFDMNSYLSDEEDSKKTNESSRKQIYKSQW
ncbi:hypothetical protein ABV23_RS01370 [Escherichia coli]|nr:hypothetical protein [Escherichia coli]